MWKLGIVEGGPYLFYGKIKSNSRQYLGLQVQENPKGSLSFGTCSLGIQYASELCWYHVHQRGPVLPHVTIQVTEKPQFLRHEPHLECSRTPGGRWLPYQTENIFTNTETVTWTALLQSDQVYSKILALFHKLFSF